MASLVDACVFIAASAGTGDFVVSAAKPGWRTPASASAVNGATYRYRAYSTDLTEWEIGTGVYTSGTVTLTRAVIRASSNAGAAVNFAAAPNVALTAFVDEFPTAAQLAKVDFLTVTQAVDLDAMETKTNFITVTQAVDLDAIESLAGSALQPSAIGVSVQAYDADLTTWAGVTSSANGRSLVSAADYAAMRTLLGLVIGTNVQAYDADLTTWAGLAPSANAQSLVTAADYAAMRTLLGLVIGTNVQAYDADLTTWAGITPGANVGTFLATPSSANLLAAVTDETGTGALVFASSPTLVDPLVTGTILEDVYTITDGAAFEIDPGNGSVQLITLGASRTPAATNFAAGESVTLMVADGTAYTITWTTVGVVWVGGSAPTLATTGYTVIELWKVGSTIYGAYVGAVA